MAKGDPVLSPWIYEAMDYVGLVIRITVTFDNTTRALIAAVVHRDPGCQYTKIVFDVPSDGVRSKRLAAPNDNQSDRTYTATQMANFNLNTIEDIFANQITAEP